MKIFLTISAILCLSILPSEGFLRKNLFPDHGPANVFANFDMHPSQYAADSDALFLTPYIEKGQIDVAQQKAMINGIPNGDSSLYNLISYSGFITVNKTTDSNMFFWFFPARVSLYPIFIVNIL